LRQGSTVQAQNESDTMKAFIDRHIDALTAVGVALALLPLALAYFDILTY